MDWADARNYYRHGQDEGEEDGEDDGEDDGEVGDGGAENNVLYETVHSRTWRRTVERRPAGP